MAAWKRLSAPEPGTTVTLRVETPVGAIGVVGVLVGVDGETWTVRRRDGTLTTVEESQISASRVVPPGRAVRAPVEEVARIAALGWRALEVARLGDWLLRASGGFTRRANSALALGDPGMPLPAALDATQRWYAERGLTCRVQLVGGGASAGLGELLDARGWGVASPTHVMAAELGHVLRAADARASADPLEERVDEAPDDAWLGCYRPADDDQQAIVREVLTNHPAAGFASLRESDSGRVLAVARGVVDDRWAGVAAVVVAPGERRRRLATTVTAAALRWCGRRGARRTSLQVEAANTAAIALYEGLGYTRHHGYTYREPPASAARG